MLYRKPSFLRALPALLLIALVAACSRAPEPEPTARSKPADSNTEVVVIARDDGPVSVTVQNGPPPMVIHPEASAIGFPNSRDERNEDPSDKPNYDLSENPNDDPYDNESPYPSGFGSSSGMIGLGGGISGGGGGGGKGGFAYRRARGGGGRAVPAINPQTEALRWLADHQNSAGYWSLKNFAADTTRSGAKQTHNLELNNPGDPTGDACDTEDEIMGTSLALLGFTGGGYDHKTGDFRGAVRSALLYLRKTQDNDGCFGYDNDSDIKRHAIAMMAISEVYGLSGDPVLKPMCDMGADYLLKKQISGSGWGTGDADLLSTGWCVRALKTAKLAGLSFTDTKAMQDVETFLDQMQYTDKEGVAHATYSALELHAPRPAATKSNPRNNLLEGVWVTTALYSGRKELKDEDVKQHVSTLTSTLPKYEAGQIDFDFWYWGTSAAFQFGEPAWTPWERALDKAVREHQRGFGSTEKGTANAGSIDEYGSWDPVGIQGPRFGRVHATTLALLTSQLALRYTAATPAKSTGPDTGKDGLADAPDMDGFSRSQSASNKSNCGKLVARNGATVVGEFPLRHTDVHAKVSGTLAGTTVTQTFNNPYNTAIEAMYTFPLPSDSAINDFVMQIGKRRIIGVIRSREEAVKVYRDAKARGYTASLLTQNRPNVFTQSVANIETGGEVKVSITYYQRLKYQDGRFEYVFPMTLTPRFKPGESGSHEVAPESESDSDSRGEPLPEPEPETEAYPPLPEPEPEPEPPMPEPEPEPYAPDDIDDPNWIPQDAPRGMQDRDELDNPEDFDVHALPPGMRSGMDIDLTVEIDAGLPIDVARTRSLAHEILLNMTNEGRAVVSLSKKDAIPNRDFVLRWGIAGEAPEVGLLTHTDSRGSYLSLQVQPQLDPADADITPREVTFILDNSGSMSGPPSQMSKQIIRKTLDSLQPNDKFNLVYFAGSNAQLFETPADNTTANVESAREFLGKTKAGGGTMMLPALQRALKMEHDPQHLQIFAFLTDGAVGNEAEILKMIKEEGQDARFFAFGVGSSVNRYLIDGIAEQGQGKAIYCMPRNGDYDEEAVEEFFGAIDRPVLCDIDIDWNGLDVDQAYPAKLNDLFASQPLSLQARYSGSGKHTIYVRGRVGARRVEYPVELDLSIKHDNPAIASIWARSKISELEKQLISKPGDVVLENDVLNTAMEFNLMSSQTSFVAVDESRVVSDGSPMRVWQPVEMPEGVTFKGDEAAADESKAYYVKSWGLWVGQTSSGRVIVVKVKDGSAAADAGMQPGQILETVNGIKVGNLEALENVLLQAVAKVEVETSLTDNGQRVEAKFKLPEMQAEK